MCGISGILAGKNNDLPIIQTVVKSLERVQYRGYDSAGIAFINGNGQINIVKVAGKISDLSAKLDKVSQETTLAIGHTRWATHGKVTDSNSHPHSTKKVAIVHNGIIENYLTLKEALIQEGYSFKSQTDSEVIAILITKELDKGSSPLEAFRNTVKMLVGSFAIAGIINGITDGFYIAKKHIPLIVGYDNKKQIYGVGSDPIAIGDIVKNLIYLEDGDYGEVSIKEGIKIFNKKDEQVERESTKMVPGTIEQMEMGEYETYMLKEIHEQANIVAKITSSYINIGDGKITFNDFKISPDYDRVIIVACGTSYHAGLIASHYFERYAGIETSVFISSEFRYREIGHYDNKQILFIFISQSGETNDTINAIKYVKDHHHQAVAITNSQRNTLSQLADHTIQCHAGPEVGVAATKTFTAQVVIMMIMALGFAQVRKGSALKEQQEFFQDLLNLPNKIKQLLSEESENIAKISDYLIKYKSVIYIGRGESFGLAMEGALKMKELSYIHAEAIAAGELKHGAIALIDDEIPTIAILNGKASIFHKSASNVQEVMSRLGQVILIGDIEAKDYFNAIEEAREYIKYKAIIPESSEFVFPILSAVVLQLLSYYTAQKLGRNIDRPRNLAKSVTVE